MNILRQLLEHPDMRGRDVDDPRTTEIRRELIRSKPFLRHLYEEQYGRMLKAVPEGPGQILELGAGGGFLKEIRKDVIRSDILSLSDLDLVCDATALPFESGSLRAVLMFDAFHHIPDVGAFLHEAARAVRPGGVVSMVEPWPTAWSRFVYRRLHHEPFDQNAESWLLPPGGPLTSANGALPWIVFKRDRARFSSEHSEWSVEDICPLMPLKYLISGGVSMRSLSPGISFPLWTAAETLLTPIMPWIAMFALIRIRRR